jgi:hypothetical protein
VVASLLDSVPMSVSSQVNMTLVVRLSKDDDQGLNRSSARNRPSPGWWSTTSCFAELFADISWEEAGKPNHPPNGRLSLDERIPTGLKRDTTQGTTPARLYGQLYGRRV